MRVVLVEEFLYTPNKSYICTHVKGLLCTPSVMLLRHSMRVHVQEELVGGSERRHGNSPVRIDGS